MLVLGSQSTPPLIRPFDTLPTEVVVFIFAHLDPTCLVLFSGCANLCAAICVVRLSTIQLHNQ